MNKCRLSILEGCVRPKCLWKKKTFCEGIRFFCWIEGQGPIKVHSHLNVKSVLSENLGGILGVFMINRFRS